MPYFMCTSMSWTHGFDQASNPPVWDTVCMCMELRRKLCTVQYPSVNRPNHLLCQNFWHEFISMEKVYTYCANCHLPCYFCCISTFSTCYVTLIWPELFNCNSREIQVFVFRMASKCRTDLTSVNSDDSYRFWRLTRLFARENSTEVWCTICEDDFKGTSCTLSFSIYRHLPNLNICNWQCSPSSASLLLLFWGVLHV